jgi:hypothetical protein
MTASGSISLTELTQKDISMARTGHITRNGRRSENLSDTAVWCRTLCARCGFERGDHSHRVLRCPDRANRFNDFLDVTFIGHEELQVIG